MQSDTLEPLEESSEQKTKHPNIIFLLADDFGYGDVGYNGGRAFTPHLDEMAKDSHSIRFDRFYSSSPVCSPTRGSLLTGRNPNRFCIWRANTAGKDIKKHSDFLAPAKYPLPHSEITLAEILKEHGYSTAVFGKWHLGDLTSSSPATLKGSTTVSSSPGDNGFDTWKVTERSAPTAAPNCACFDAAQCILGHYAKRGPPPCTNYHGPANATGRLVPHPDIITKDDSEFLVDEFSSFLDQKFTKKDHRPFFIYLPFHAVHNRYLSVLPYRRLYDNWTLSSKELDYFSSISALDAAVGRIRSLLKHYNMSHDTMLWFSSDNGPAARSPGQTAGLKGHKGTLHEGGIRVPGIIEWPAAIKENRITQHPAVTSDFFPTVLDSLGLSKSLPRGHQLDGISLLPFMLNKTNSTEYERRESEHSIKWAFNVKGSFNNSYSAVILDNNYKLVAKYSNGKIVDFNLFDVSKNPHESEDVSGQHPSLTRTLLHDLEEWTHSVIASARQDSKCLAD